MPGNPQLEEALRSSLQGKPLVATPPRRGAVCVCVGGEVTTSSACDRGQRMDTPNPSPLAT